MASVSDTRPPLTEAVLLIAIGFGQSIAGAMLAFEYGWTLPEMSPDQVDKLTASMGLAYLLFGAMALVFLRGCGHRLSELLPVISLRGSLEGLLLGVLALAACLAVDTLLPLRESVMEQVRQFQSLAKPSIGMAVAMAMLYGLYQETFLLGYLMRVFASYGASFVLGLTVLVRMLCMLQYGPAGAVWALVLGLVLGMVYWRTRRLWPAVFAHLVTDLWLWLGM